VGSAGLPSRRLANTESLSFTLLGDHDAVDYPIFDETDITQKGPSDLLEKKVLEDCG
jgi:hypothetical protein